MSPRCPANIPGAPRGFREILLNYGGFCLNFRKISGKISGNSEKYFGVHKIVRRKFVIIFSSKFRQILSHFWAIFRLFFEKPLWGRTFNTQKIAKNRKKIAKNRKNFLRNKKIIQFSTFFAPLCPRNSKWKNAHFFEVFTTHFSTKFRWSNRFHTCKNDEIFRKKMHKFYKILRAESSRGHPDTTRKFRKFHSNPGVFVRDFPGCSSMSKMSAFFCIF